MTPPLGSSPWRRLFAADAGPVRGAAVTASSTRTRDPLVLARQAQLSLAAGDPEAALGLSSAALSVVGPEPTRERAQVLTHYALAQTACGHVDDALVTSAEAVALWRRAAAAKPVEHAGDLRRALADHASRLRDADRHHEAAAFTVESGEVHRRSGETGN